MAFDIADRHVAHDLAWCAICAEPSRRRPARTDRLVGRKRWSETERVPGGLLTAEYGPQQRGARRPPGAADG